jgi:hypothetical protein
MIDVKCHCGSDAVYHKSDAIIYGRQYSNRGVWVCSQFPKCDSYVGCHPNKLPLGVLKDKEGRSLAKACHKIFDRYWNACLGLGVNVVGRNDAYRYLASQLQMPVSECHFGMMNNPQLEKALQFLEKTKDTFLQDFETSQLLNGGSYDEKGYRDKQDVTEQSLRGW